MTKLNQASNVLFWWVPDLRPLGRDVSAFIEEVGAPALMLACAILFVRGVPWILGVIANGS